MSQEKGALEKIEDIDYLRFLENGKSIKTIITSEYSISVDTPKDLALVRKIIQSKQ